MALFPLGILSAAAGGVAGDYELIASEILGSSQASITFSNLGDYSSTYKHLQIRAAHRSSANSQDAGYIRFNGDSGTNYNRHFLYGTGSSVFSDPSTNAAQMESFNPGDATLASNIFGASVTDLLDVYSTTKNTTIKTLTGVNYRIGLQSGAWRNTAALTSITITLFNGNFIAGSRFSIYGIRG
jgi:hypothetical protein